MKPFEYVRAATLQQAIAASAMAGTRLLAGGTTQIDLMKCGVERPDRLLDITRLTGLDEVQVDERSVRLGALAKMSSAAAHPEIISAAPALSESLWRAASAQLRNMATLGGNLMQRTRCTYFRDVAAYPACNKRSPGSGCAAIGGVNRNHALLGTSDTCIASHASDFAVALMAFDARVLVAGPRARTIDIKDFYLLPGNTPHIETSLEPGEMILGIEVPNVPSLRRSHYLKVRDRMSYEFAVVSAAVGIELEPDRRTIRSARVAVGGVGTIPWRLCNVEQALAGAPLSEAAIRSASRDAAAGARPSEYNRHKVALLPRVVARALLVVGGIA